MEILDFKSLISEKELDYSPKFIESTDNIKLAYYFFGAKLPKANLLFIHGGGAYSLAGYQWLAEGLARKYNINTYLIDLRGHGYSQGARGDTPSIKQIFIDLRIFIDFVKKEFNHLPLYLGGHSSGAGLILNFISYENTQDINGYFFIAPQLGYKSKTAKKDEKSFVKAKTWVFILNALLNKRILGHYPAVVFNYPQSVLERKKLLLKYITCNMALAITPYNPQEQFSKIDKPFGLFIGENDELFIPEKVLQYADLAKKEIKNKSIFRIIPKENHLSILTKADDLIGQSITKFLT